MSRPDAIQVEALNRVAKDASLRAKGRRESILAFAEEHGWEVGEQYATDYFTDVRLSKGTQFVDLALWPGIRRDIASARTHTGSVCVQVADPIRERVERFITGTPCSCVADPEDFTLRSPYEGKPADGCEVHG